MKKCIGYLRVSTPQQDADRQASEIKEYCSLNNFEYLEALEIREKVTGTDTEREGLKKLKRLTKDDCDVVMMSETSRLSRNDDLLVLANDVSLITKIGLDVYFLDTDYTYKGGVLLSEAELQKLISEAASNARERKRIIKRCTTGRKSKVKTGCFIGGVKAFGYMAVPNPDRVKDNAEHGKMLYVVDETQRELVELVFDCIGNKNFTIRGTAQYLNDNGIMKDGKPCSYSTIKNIVYNPLHTGVYKFSGNTGTVPAIVTKELFDKAHIQLQSNHLFKNKGTTHYNVLKGLINCPCGGSMMLTTRANKENYYNCVRKRSDYVNYECKNFGIHSDFLTSIIWQLTQSYINRSDFELKTIEATKTLNNVIDLKDKQVTKLLQEQETLKNTIDTGASNLMKVTNSTIYKLIEDKLNLQVTEQTELTNRITKLNKELLKLRLEVENYSIRNQSKLIDSISEEEKNTIYRKYISKITYYSYTQTRGVIHVLFNNGFEAVVMTNTRREKIAYLLPQSFSFNPITRKVITRGERFESTNYKVDGFIFPTTEIIEKNYDEVILSLNMKEYQMDI